MRRGKRGKRGEDEEDEYYTGEVEITGYRRERFVRQKYKCRT